MKYSVVLFALILSFTLNARGQIGGEGVYGFMELQSAARTAALGGELIALQDEEVSLAYGNPALLNGRMDGHLGLNYIPYFAGINYGYAATAKQLNARTNLAAGIHYVNYGEFIRADVNGIKRGHFRAAEYAMQFTYNRVLIDSMLYAGISVKPILSSLERYTSLGLSTDWGLLFTTSGKRTQIAFVARHLGTQITSYYGHHREPLPINVLLGVSQKLAHAPFRFHLTLHHLHKWHIASQTGKESTADPFDNPTAESPAWETAGSELLHHMLLGAEILLMDAFTLNIGYNHQRRQEMALPEAKGMHGFSYGLNLKLQRFRISYARAAYHAAGASNHFSVNADLNAFF